MRALYTTVLQNKWSIGTISFGCMVVSESFVIISSDIFCTAISVGTTVKFGLLIISQPLNTTRTLYFADGKSASPIIFNGKAVPDWA